MEYTAKELESYQVTKKKLYDEGKLTWTEYLKIIKFLQTEWKILCDKEHKRTKELLGII